MTEDREIIRNVLFLINTYRVGLKDCVDITAPYYKQGYVIFRYNIISEISNILPLKSLKPFRKSELMDLRNKPQNLTIFPAGLFYLPTDNQYKKLGVLFYRAARKKIMKNRVYFDIVHSHFLWPQGYAGARFKEEYAVPFVVTAHGYDIYSLPFKDEEWKKKIEDVLNAADHIITVSQRNLSCIKKLNTSTPVTVIPNGFRSDLFFPRDTSVCRKVLNLPQDKKIILTVGIFEPIKGHKYLIEAMHAIISERKDVLCVIVGGGGLRTTLERQIHALGLEDYVRLVDGKPHDEIPLWMNACDLFVLPSLDEGNPIVMFEVLGCGKPFVGTRVGGVPQVIISDTYGLLVRPGDTGELAEKILTALDWEWNREEILTYAEQFTWENIVKEILGVYTKVSGSM
jgi:glycosyltransferase involved in cell wall biosynthesis